MINYKDMLKILNEIYNGTDDIVSMYLKLYEIIEYFDGSKTPEYKYKIEKKYPIVKELKNAKVR